MHSSVVFQRQNEKKIEKKLQTLSLKDSHTAPIVQHTDRTSPHAGQPATLCAPCAAPSSSSRRSYSWRQLPRPWLPSLSLSPAVPKICPEEPVKEAHASGESVASRW
jgi:hypothetical protein